MLPTVFIPLPPRECEGGIFQMSGARERICARKGRERAPGVVRHPPTPFLSLSHMEHLSIQSVLFQSPYSGCPAFSGWPKDPCQKPLPRGGDCANTLSARICVDAYRPGWRERHPIGTLPRGAQLQRRPCPVIPAASFRVCQRSSDHWARDGVEPVASTFLGCALAGLRKTQPRMKYSTTRITAWAIAKTKSTKAGLQPLSDPFIES